MLTVVIVIFMFGNILCGFAQNAIWLVCPVLWISTLADFQSLLHVVYLGWALAV